MPRSVPEVVIIGGGFGGLAAARGLRRARVCITLVDRRNHHLFQPLLYQVATAGLSPGDIAEPIRGILGRQRNVAVRLAEVRGVDLAARRVRFDGEDLGYDHLIIAAGVTSHYFGHDSWEGFAPGLKTLDDALEIRQRILGAFERAEWTADPEVRRRQLGFVVVGGGPTGVEMAGAIAEIALHTLRRDFRNIDPAAAEVHLVEMGPDLLPGFPPRLRQDARRHLEGLGVRVHLGEAVSEVDGRGVTAAGGRLHAETVIWAAGVRPEGLPASLGTPRDRAGRLRVEPDLSLPGHPEVSAIGDIACFEHDLDRPLPGVAPVAIQMGRCAAANLLARIRGEPTRPFRYRDPGTMATVGRSRAVAALGPWRFRGLVAWLLWVFVHLMALVGFRNRLVVFVQWVWSYFTFQRNARLMREAPARSAAEAAPGPHERKERTPAKPADHSQQA